MTNQDRSSIRHHRPRLGRAALATVAAFGLIAAACSSDKTTLNQDTTPTTLASGTPTTAAPPTTTIGSTGGSDGTTATTAGSPGDTAAPTTVAAKKPVPGGELVVSGEAEVANPWTPAAMQCDPYCYQRAFTFFDVLATIGADNKVHPNLAESIEPNADFTEWTLKMRPGVNFTDGTPVNADAVMRNLNETGTGVLVSKSIVDVARQPDPGGATNADGSPKIVLKMEKKDDLTFTIFMGKGGDPTQPLPWPNFPVTLIGQLGLIASPKWLDEVVADPTKASMPVGSGPFIVQSFAPRDDLVVTRNPNYWQKDADGVQLPYLDKITFKVIEDAQTSAQALQSGDIDITSTSRASIIADFREKADQFPMLEQEKFGDTYYLMIDLAKQNALQDQRVRCAMSMAVDREEMKELVGGGITPVANGLFSPGQEGYLEDNGFDPAQNLDEAKKLIDAYKQETGSSTVQVELGSVADRITQQAADLLGGYWKQIGVDTKQTVIPQDQYITNALFGADNYVMYQWRSHSGVSIDQQNFWWNSSSGTTDGPISLNFARINDPAVDAALAESRSDPDPAKRQAAAEEVNRIFAKNCYSIPLSWTIWGTPHKPSVQGLSDAVLPDGSPLLLPDATGFSGIFPTVSVWIDKG